LVKLSLSPDPLYLSLKFECRLAYDIKKRIKTYLLYNFCENYESLMDSTLLYQFG